MLVRLGVVACLFWLHYAYATTLKITNVVPFGSSSVKMVFNQEVKKFKEVSLKNFKSYLELEAILTIPKKHYQFSKQSFITIAQFSPKLARVVIGYAPKMTYEVKILKDKLYISIVEKKPLIRHQITPKPPKHHALKHQVPKPTPKPIKKEAKKTKEKTPTKHAHSKQTHSPLNERSPKKEIPKKEAENESKNQIFITEKNDTWIKTKRKKHKKIVLDAGHGGKDCGAMSTNLVCEKDIVLEVVKFLHKELKKRGYSVLLTRDKDIYIDLVARTELANKKSADLFISVHANSIPKRSTSNAHGIETYFLSTARSERARKVAEQENKDDVNLMDYFSKSLFLNSLNTQRLIISNKLAIDVQYGMLQSVRKNYPDVVDGGVREGPFWVLAGALMPSILIEIGYNSHAIESKRIQSKPYQKILAKGIADGIDSFFSKND
ncbi:N-acetylmuramoyl-L-alanine amidase family protein [Helicobacter pylori]|uniref:N-acetylmuramoyl-L-alanine amidase family protein n=1 Tax=Helicobacter pylori TaxID=210 RepID=UPI00026B211A|nr:N-acetylmuramoyl-L-alanine amidase [Helicobacter pylori]EJC18162.1 N-acetylmuramoyl-L-alanine amidase family protein [Helicobacter pylori Hp H-24b]EJC21306.1 N-acetylmuramoyl-L-alanine amidase family protein [Helicobacter pylori Hp H-24c]EJC38070.1 N-acetylmuramoyl-L-alanine amidase [Helicobacter pylori Hp M1]EJC41808.1 N-acetylmuramoyl-L-alanine amidase [Helicobacter pylori Hp M2]EJC43363.1 N-acetylmuramoyl-L-alanine amidase [Helicobacter pylori Hp M4]